MGPRNESSAAGEPSGLHLREATARDLPAVLRHRELMFRDMGFQHLYETLGFKPTNETRLDLPETKPE